MERTLSARLKEGGLAYDANLYGSLQKLGADYVKAGVRAVNFHLRDFDAANDSCQCFGQVTRQDFEKDGPLEPRHFIHPMTATEMATLATFVSQILAGTKSIRRVEARGDEDEEGAEQLNELLQWNDDQQSSYWQMFLWIWDACVFNRGIMYERWTPIYDVELEPVEEEDTSQEPVHGMNKRGLPRFTRGGEPIMVYPTTIRFRKKRKVVGGYTAIEIVSPYDFISDPMLPFSKLQQGRFCGHRVVIPWHELDRRSKLDPSDYDYVLPAAVARLKQRKTQTNVMAGPGAPAANASLQSRSFLERTRRGLPQGGLGATDAVNKEDGGMVECYVLYVTAKPSAHNIYKDDDENERIEFLMAGEKELLSVNIQPNTHDEYPYCVGEARPNAHRQFSPSWAMVIKGPQDHVDDLNWRHSEHLARSGVIILADGTKVDLADFLENTGRIRQVVMVKEEAAGTPLNQCAEVFKVDDPTKQFPEEMEFWKKQSEEATGAHAFIQGQKEGPDTTATEFVGVQQMATGRISSIARLLAEPGISRQTRRIAMNFQQFLPDEVTVRIRDQSSQEYDPDKAPSRQRTILRDNSAFPPEDPRSEMPDIQCEFDLIPHDGSLPSADTQKVAALSRAIEAFASQPMLAPMFDDTIPGNFDIKEMFADLLKDIGVRTNNYRISRETALKNLRAKMIASGQPLPPELDPNAQQPSNVTPMPPQEAPGIPSASQLPPTPSAAPPAPMPAAIPQV